MKQFPERKYCILFILSVCFGFFPLNIYAQNGTTNEYIIGAGDVLNIQIWDNEDLNRKVEVSQEGDFTFPLIGKVHATGLSIFEIETLLKKKLEDGYLVSPQVNVNIQEYRNQKIFLFGRVKKPGSHVLKRKTNIMELISEYGGFLEETGMSVTIVRPKTPQEGSSPISPEGVKDSQIFKLNLGEMGSDNSDNSFLVMPGDSIYVSKASRIFITGEVKKPGIYGWEKMLTVRKAISLAGGSTPRGAPERSKILRTENGAERQFIPEMSDLVRPDDIIKVPKSYF